MLASEIMFLWKDDCAKCAKSTVKSAPDKG